MLNVSRLFSLLTILFLFHLPVEAKLKSEKQLAKIESEGVVNQNTGKHLEALKLYEQACSQGRGSACVRQAHMEEKVGSLDKAKELLFIECEDKDSEACHDLGRLLLKQSESLGKLFLLKSCTPPSFAICKDLSKSTPEALTKYIQSFDQDWDTDKGKTRGNELLIEACKLGHTISCEVLEENKKGLPTQRK